MSSKEPSRTRILQTYLRGKWAKLVSAVDLDGDGQINLPETGHLPYPDS